MLNHEDIFREINIRLLRRAMEIYQEDIARYQNEEEDKKSIQRARELLKHFLEPEQWEEFKEYNYFTYRDSQNRNWKFVAREHYPIECSMGYNEHYRICIDSDPEAPVEDLLLQCYLEVKGGRGEEFLPKYNGINEGNVEENTYGRVEPRAYRDDFSILVDTILRFYPELRGYEIVRGRARNVVCCSIPYAAYSVSYGAMVERTIWEEITIEEHVPIPGIKLYFGVNHRARILVVSANPQS